MKYKFTALVLCAVPASLLLVVPVAAPAQAIDEIIVTADFRERAFEPFTRADPARDLGTGTAGLGLSIARGIVTAHGGTIGLADGPGGVVEIALPV